MVELIVAGLNSKEWKAVDQRNDLQKRRKDQGGDKKESRNGRHGWHGKHAGVLIIENLAWKQQASLPALATTPFHLDRHISGPEARCCYRNAPANLEFVIFPSAVACKAAGMGPPHSHRGFWPLATVCFKVKLRVQLPSPRENTDEIAFCETYVCR